MKDKALFLDRDGIINVDKHYLYKIEEVQFCQGIFELCKYFKLQNYIIIVVTNQSGINRKYYSEKDLVILHEFMRLEFEKKGIKISKFYHCPHLESENCECRKPAPGMIKQALKDFNINVSTSFLLGDKLSDMQAGQRAGIKNLFLINENFKEKFDYFKIFKNLNECLDYFKKGLV
ncbi:MULTISPECIES: D-glycero-alpha-D-manno-heptose-1,7-bisphosphate 7-phosphatase [unclassified Campylobacter]|uniref:D-glycero-alpha-D-manno-heptose-1,7-bisphosphate 7-phosphatase n=1 Tax=unclassified Campylobacter TaxID=2593542 RepID=UPI001237C53A|nr:MULTISPECIES: HAD family hydrolase [unclassified Campylobacter]KAA6226734.1 HAD family hydrolase [Campylobacter sp. LR196d]KAA6229073.1 HAD family hydrolase [Campylobacter sp. LR286c]KAA6230171.1 HAD family hydrolase [Campylobacter sp. LR291e]KAA6233692.1 HAD family hydrolase [Campylobacter sp. LR264d]